MSKNSIIANPAFALPEWGYVNDLTTKQAVRYDPNRICPDLHNAMLAWGSSPPRNEDGFALWPLVLAPRQCGKSFITEAMFYPMIANIPGYSHVCIADKRGRARRLHQRIHFLDRKWDERAKGTRINLMERQKITFDPDEGGEGLILSAQNAADGLGDSYNSLHLSEVAFYPDLDEMLSYTIPAIENVRDGLVVAECTPAPQSAAAPSADAWRDLFTLGMKGEGRWRSVFIPLMASKVHVREWKKEWTLDLEEQRLLDKLGHLGLTKAHLAFRREKLATDRKIAENPALFFTFYPVDPITCWGAVQGGAFGQYHMDLLAESSELDRTKSGERVEFFGPKPGARYAVFVDPAGQDGMNDHVGIHVFELWDDRIEQAYRAGARMPQEVAGALIEELSNRYNNAKIIIENNGVGNGTIMYLKMRGLGRRMMSWKPDSYEYAGYPTTAQTLPMMLEATKYAIEQGWVVLHDLETFGQLQTYRNDKVLQQKGKQAILTEARGATPKHRRHKHHWDVASSLVVGLWVCTKFMVRPTRVVPVKMREPLDPNAWYAQRIADRMKAQDAAALASTVRSYGHDLDYRPIEE